MFLLSFFRKKERDREIETSSIGCLLHAQAPEVLNMFQHQFQSLKSKVSSTSKCHLIQVWWDFRHHSSWGKVLSSCQRVKANNFCASKTQWLNRRRIDIPIPKRRNRKEGRVTGPKQVQNVVQQTPWDLYAQDNLLCFHALPSGPTVVMVLPLQLCRASPSPCFLVALPSRLWAEATWPVENRSSLL